MPADANECKHDVSMHEIEDLNSTIDSLQGELEGATTLFCRIYVCTQISRDMRNSVFNIRFKGEREKSQDLEQALEGLQCVHR